MGKFGKHLPALLFVVSVIIASFAVGMYTTVKRVFPYPQAKNAQEILLDMKSNWKSDLGIRPTRYLKARPHPGDGVTMNAGDSVAPGYILLSGFFKDSAGLKLVDRTGTLVHSWPVDYHRIFRDTSFIQRDKDRPKGTWNWEIQGVLAQPDGSVVVNFYFAGLAKLDRCGEVIWTLPRQTHHIVIDGADGTFWTPASIWHETTPERLEPMKAPFYENRIVQIGPDGKVLRDISILELLIRNDMYAVMSNAGQYNPFRNSGFDSDDPLHVNDINIVTAEQAAKVPGMSEGDILVSARNLNLLLAFDPDTLKVTWYQVGPWVRQHDPEILADGRISVFNNNYRIGASNIMTLDPLTREARVIYGSEPETEFYTACCGRQRQLPNGNILVTSTMEGRVFEIDGSANKVWEYVNSYDEDHVAWLADAVHYPKTYFQPRALQCTAQQTSAN